MTAIPAQAKAALNVVFAVTEVIREAERIPSGTLYAVLMDKMSLETYERVIALIVRTGLVRKQGQELVWIGPEVGA